MEVPFGKYQIKTKTEKERRYIFDIVRKRWFVLTPEEQVRQVWIHFLHNGCSIPLHSMVVEKQILIGDRPKRFDIAVLNAESQFETLIECKAAHIPLQLPNVEQLFLYNHKLHATQFVLTNGIEHLGWKIIENQLVGVEKFEELGIGRFGIV